MAGDTAIIFRSGEPGDAGGPGPAPVRTGPDGAATHILTAPTPAAAAVLAAEYADRGVTTVELCGATGYPWVAEVEAAVRGRARVGTVLYGFESLIGIARYKERATAGEAQRALFVHVQPGADPATDRFVRTEGAGSSTFVAVPEAAAGAAVAAEFAASVQLIELYGGWGPESVAAVIRAVDERVPVGVAVHTAPPPVSTG
ncbi:DUF6506 family protein [Streptomyces yaizuensis]|uniref:DUF6506 family protein n=1 Tax=Streptomyces yaizuensis TaxID=2989713 RepID=A0ABQ5PBL6_9ACTN|nr:DUF6506 family protein [Streptomyces sp. YSPA8]GLF99890.1 DUF6506 family protein [Streptomyces sp. YSPA8]